MGQDVSAEEADAVLRLEGDGDHMVMLSVVPGGAEDKWSSEAGGGTCGAGGEEDSSCKLRESLFSLDSAGTSFPEREEEDDAERGAAESERVPAEETNNTDSLKSPKVTCEERNVTGFENLTLKILNMSQVSKQCLPSFSACTDHFTLLSPFRLRVTSWLGWKWSSPEWLRRCCSLSTRFGTVAVPNILLFQGAKPVARFNHTDRTLETLNIFIFNQTGIEAKKNAAVTQADQIGPLPSTLIKSVDWLLVFSLFFLISFIMYATIRTESIRWLIPGQEQEHVE
ncbi:thioredoxin domain-containing protein 15 [Echinops telfairi]|uniref:Thioredoxin domain-containing protein 15 n=1 Tax=Echinops telfairi TaxID=9371 RepID=A0AC55CR15_ECHTE|nr:thioredoxin domain-containing protein 15 [Echinops telfairi]